MSNPSTEKKGGFQQPQQPQDEWTVRLYEKHGLSRTPSLEEIEEKATELLASPLTSLSAAEMVLGRRVDGKEKEIAKLLFTPGLAADEKFGLLLMEKDIEKAKAAKAKK